MSQLGDVLPVLLLVAGVVVLAGAALAAVAVVGLQLALALALRRVERFAERHSQPTPRRSPTAKRTGARHG